MNTNTAAAYSESPRHLQAVQGSGLAQVFSIDSAPSIRRRKMVLRAEDPAMHRRPVVATQTVVSTKKRILRGVVGVSLVVAAGGVGVGAGIAAQPDPYAGPTTTYTVGAGESIWSIAQAMDADRPVSDVVFDIQQMNGVDGGLQAGQTIVLPLE